MRDEDTCLLRQLSHEDQFEDSFLDVGIQGREWIVHQKDVFVSIDRSRQADSRFLSSAEIDAFLTDLGHVARGKNLQVSL